MEFYVHKYPYPIFFLENSAYDFSADSGFQELLKKNNITLVKFPVSARFEEGKGYQEFEMIDRSIDTIRNGFNSFIKISGRYVIHNLDKVIDKSAELCMDVHEKLKVAKTLVFYSTFAFYRENSSGFV